MNTTHIFKAGLFSLLAVTAACTADDSWTVGDVNPQGEENTAIRRVAMAVEDFTWSDTRTRVDMNVSDADVKFNWKAGDEVGVFPGQSAYQTLFSVNQTLPVGEPAVFDGGGWSLRKASTYTAYYPFVEKFGLDQTALTVSYLGQEQTANNSTAHLSPYDFLGTAATTAEGEKVNFSFLHAGCLARFVVSGLPAGKYTQMDLSTDQPVFVTEATMDVSTQNLTATKKVKKLSYKLGNIALTKGSDLTLYLMMAPADLTGRKVSLTMHANKQVFMGNLNGGKTFGKMEKAKAYRFTAAVK